MSLPDRNPVLAPVPTSPPTGVTEDGEPGFAFARYRLFPQRWLLLADDKPVELKSRAFEMLLALVEARGNLVTKEELRERVWPCTVVEPQNIDLQIHILRKAFGADRHLIRTDTGRGYRLAVAVRTIPDSADTPAAKTTTASEPSPPAAATATNLPTPISPLIGRDRELGELQELIAKHRLVTLTGAGGIGKTQLGLELARLALPGFADGAWNIELASLVDPDLVPGAIARTLGIEPASGPSAAGQLATALQHKHLLLVLDNCEHVVAVVARMAETLLHGAPRLHILATSQELLAAEGEHIYRVDPLKVPPSDLAGAARVMEHSAVQLFVERARASDPRFALDDRTAPAVGNICRYLDGLPLAIELAAARVATIGLAEVAKRLDDRFRLLTGGRRAALKRHQTLRAALDWSYGLLEESKRAVLRHVAIFAGSFTLGGAMVVAKSGGIEALEAADHVADLVSKSLIVFDGLVPRYRLLDTTRLYALEKLAENGEFEATARRHAEYYRALLEHAEGSWQTTPAADLVSRYGPEVDNIRAALNWALETEGDPPLGVALAAASIPLWTLLSVLGDCRDLVGRALSHVDKGSDQQKRHEMSLQAALGRSSMWAQGAVSEAERAAERAIELAERLDDPEYQLRALYNLWIYRLRIGEYRRSLAIAQRFGQIAGDRTDMPAALTGARLEGVSLFHLGDHNRARSVLERAIDVHGADVRRSFVVRFGLDQRVSALSCLARILWLQGFPDQAARAALTAVEEARVLNHANSLCIALCFGACSVAAMSGDVGSVEELVPVLTDFAERHHLGMWQADCVAFKGWLALRQGDSANGLRLLTAAFGDFHETRLGLHPTIFTGALAEALGLAGRIDEGLAVIDDAIKEATRMEATWCLAELRRVSGELLLRDALPAKVIAAEKSLLEAIDLARRQGARSWQLRAATSLARLWHKQDRNAEARALLAPVYREFTEGFDTPDLRAAKTLVETLEGLR